MLYIYFISTLIVPIAIINKIAFVILVFLTVIQLNQKKQFVMSTMSPVFILMIFFYGYINSLTGNVDTSLAIQFALFPLSLFLIYPIQQSGIDINKLVKICGIILMVLTLVLYMLFINKVDVVYNVLETLKNYNLVAAGLRGYFGEDRLFFHLGTVPFLFLSACLFFKDFLIKREFKTFLIIILMAFTMCLSSARALVIGLILGIVALMITRTKGYTKLFALNVTFCIFIFATIFIGFNSDVFNPNEVSNKVKIGHVQSFIDNLTTQNVLLGDGLASYYYSEGSNRYTAHTEITVLDVVRYFGIPLAFLLYFFWIFPVFKLNSYKGQGKEVLMMFLIYIAMSMSNPIFVNSMGALVILWYWTEIIRYNKTSQNFAR